ncbi:SDR family NAD(P)-dependent oxidoreductase [Halegenticoccus soli]|uniref:SDR family NAD(P)-dependent oxidoreductase n=1 Tax=Halegenticoccus soli TaxID=1985678 RepID=UPI000C6C9482|nr:SDR family oxidoreductase [Halegenticoccus soli]
MDGKTVVVTGASRGIGEQVVRAFAAEGAHVVCCARDVDALEAVVDDVETSGGRASGLRADVRDEYDLERLMERAARVNGEIDVVVACAAVAHGEPGATPLADEPYSGFDDTLRTNVRGVFAAVKEALPHLAGDARVLIPSGSVARDAKPGTGAYAVSKAAAEALARGFAADVEQAVGIVDPGLIGTDLSGGRGRDPADVAPMFVWAATEVDPDELNGGRLDLKAWRRATR